MATSFVLSHRKGRSYENHGRLTVVSWGGHIEPDEDPNQAAIREVKALEQLSVNKR